MEDREGGLTLVNNPYVLRKDAVMGWYHAWLREPHIRKCVDRNVAKMIASFFRPIDWISEPLMASIAGSTASLRYTLEFTRSRHMDGIFYYWRCDRMILDATYTIGNRKPCPVCLLPGPRIFCNHSKGMEPGSIQELGLSAAHVHQSFEARVHTFVPRLWKRFRFLVAGAKSSGKTKFVNMVLNRLPGSVLENGVHHVPMHSRMGTIVLEIVKGTAKHIPDFANPDVIFLFYGHNSEESVSGRYKQIVKVYPTTPICLVYGNFIGDATSTVVTQTLPLVFAHMYMYYHGVGVRETVERVINHLGKGVGHIPLGSDSFNFYPDAPQKKQKKQ
jgi:hypothetical protein